MIELLEALVVEDGDRGLQREEMLTPSEVIACCKSLVIYDESNELVRFAHYSVQEFIGGSLQQKLPPASDLAKTCLTYLAFDEFETPCTDYESLQDRIQQFEFSSYAAQFWAIHVTKGDAERLDDIQRAIFGILACDNKKNLMLQLDPYSFSDQTFIHIVAKNGLATICALILYGGSIGSSERFHFHVRS